MRIVFFGSSEFALKPLTALAGAGFRPLCVVTQPDKSKARGLTPAGTLIKNEALRRGLEVFQPEDINSGVSIEFLRELKPDLFVVVAYGQMLSETVLAIPVIMPVNLHPSLLPKYRGAAPLNWAIIKGETSTGVSIVKMTKRMDAGPVLRSKAADILKEDDAVSLGDRLSGLGADLLIETVREIERGNSGGIPQKEEDATFAPLLKKEDGRIDWNNSAYCIRNLVRGCAGWPGTFTCFRGRLLKIKETKVIEENSSADIPVSPGRIVAVSPQGMEISCGKGRLSIKKLQPESKKEMTAEEFINGYKPLVGECFTGLL